MQESVPTQLPGCGFRGGCGHRSRTATRLIRREAARAILGGEPVRGAKFPRWPIIARERRTDWMEVLRKRATGAGIEATIRSHSKNLGADHGRQALLAGRQRHKCTDPSLAALGIGPGDEVSSRPTLSSPRSTPSSCITPCRSSSTPTRETFQIDARQIEAAITERTACIMPVHLGGNAADMDTIRRSPRSTSPRPRRRLPGATSQNGRTKKSARSATSGCFSFQASKNLNSGEGGPS